MSSFPTGFQTGLSYSLQGMNQAQTQCNTAAKHIATQGASPTDSVALISARDDNAANVQAARVEDDMTNSTLSLLA